MTWDYYDIKKKLPDNITGVEMRRMSDAKSYKN